MPRTFHSITDLRPGTPEARDQGHRSSCVAFAVTACHEFHRRYDINLSEEFLFRCCKIRDNTENGGTSVQNAFNNLIKLGQVPHLEMPYELSPKSSVLAPLPLKHYRSARRRRVTEWSLDTSGVLTIESLINTERPVVVVLQVSDEFFYPAGAFIDYKAQSSGVLPLHAILCMGFGKDNAGQLYFIIRNSWGTEWGDKGYAYLSYEYYRNLSRGAWTINN